MWLFWKCLIFWVFSASVVFLDDLDNLDASLSRFLVRRLIGCTRRESLQRKKKGREVEIMGFN